MEILISIYLYFFGKGGYPSSHIQWSHDEIPGNLGHRPLLSSSFFGSYATTKPVEPGKGSGQPGEKFLAFPDPRENRRVNKDKG